MTNQEKKESNYVCPRCGYSTPKCSSIKAHFAKKKPCPTYDSDIELTQTVINSVLKNKVCKIKNEKPETKVDTVQPQNVYITNITNNTNNSINFVLQKLLEDKPFESKLEIYTQYKNLAVETLEDKAKTACAYLGWYDHANNKIKDAHHVIKSESCKELFDKMSSITDDRISTIMKQPNNDSFKVYDGSNFVSKSELDTIKSMIDAVQTVFFDQYEYILIKKIEDEHLDENVKLRCFNILKAYYLLLHSAQMSPKYKNMTVWLKMTSENTPEKIQHTYSDLVSIVQDNAHRVQKYYTEVVQEFFNKMIISVTL